MRPLKIILFSLIMIGMSACCTPIYIVKGTTIMNGRCTDLAGCAVNPHDVIPAWRV